MILPKGVGFWDPIFIGTQYGIDVLTISHLSLLCSCVGGDKTDLLPWPNPKTSNGSDGKPLICPCVTLDLE